MAINNNTAAITNVVPIRQKRGVSSPVELSFDTTDHIDAVGTKAKEKIMFTTESARDAFYNQLVIDYYLSDYDLTKSSNIATSEPGGGAPNEFTEDGDGTASRGVGDEYYIIIEAKQVGTAYNNISLPNGSYTVVASASVVGTDHSFKKNYNLAVFVYEVGNTTPLFKELYPHDGSTTAEWNIDVLPNIKPYLYNSKIPQADATTPIRKIVNPVSKFQVVYAEAYQDDTVNDGAMTLYNFGLALELTLSNGRLRVGETPDNSYYNPSAGNFPFLNTWERSQDLPICRESHEWLYAYVPDTFGISYIQLETTLYFNQPIPPNGAVITHTVSLTEFTSSDWGVYEFAVGPQNSPAFSAYLSDLDKLTNYEVKVIFSDGTNTYTSETFAFEISERCCGYELYYTNRLGVWQSMRFDSYTDTNRSKNLQLQSTNIKLYSDGNTYSGGTITNYLEADSSFMAFSNFDFNTPALKKHLEDFLMEQEKLYRHKDNGLFYVANGNGKEFGIETLSNATRLNFEFTTNHLV